MTKFSIQQKPKISLIGSGNIGGTCAYLIASRNLADVVLFDIVEGLPQGKALDISSSIVIEEGDISVIGTNNYSDISDSDVIIVTAGITRSAQKSTDVPFDRSQLLAHNAKIITSVAKNIKKYAPNAFVIVITNPLDSMAWLMHKASGLAANMVVGMAGGLDTSRFCYFLGQELGISPKKIQGMIIGEHSNHMLPLARFSKIDSLPLDNILKEKPNGAEILNSVIKKTKETGGRIIELMGTSAYCAPATAAIDIAASYLHNKKKTILCSTLLNGEYGVNNIFMGTPVVIGNNGVEKVIELDLTDSERNELQNSVISITKLLDALKETTSF